MFAINAAWLELALTGIDLLAWTQHLLCDGDLATAEPKKLRYRLLHVAARITRSARQTRLRIAANWPWAGQLVAAFTRLAALPLTAQLNTGPTPTNPRRRNPTPASGHRHAPIPTGKHRKINKRRRRLDQQLAKDRG